LGGWVGAVVGGMVVGGTPVANNGIELIGGSMGAGGSG